MLRIPIINLLSITIMKNICNFISIGIVLLSFTACEKGYIDDISQVAAGPDELAPTAAIITPANATVVIPFTDTKTDYTFKFSGSDDIELKSIDIALDGTQLA